MKKNSISLVFRTTPLSEIFYHKVRTFALTTAGLATGLDFTRFFWALRFAWLIVKTTTLVKCTATLQRLRDYLRHAAA